MAAKEDESSERQRIQRDHANDTDRGKGGIDGSSPGSGPPAKDRGKSGGERRDEDPIKDTT